MKKTLIALFGAAFLALAPTAALAQSCYPFENAKADVASTDPNATWEYLKEGPRFNALLIYIKQQYGPNAVEHVDGILISYKKGKDDGKDYVLWALSPDGKCADMTTFQSMSPEQFAAITGGTGPGL